MSEGTEAISGAPSRPRVWRRPALTKKQRAAWERQGFLVLPRFFSRRRVEGITRVVEEEWRIRQRPENPLVLDVLEGPLAGRRMYFRDAPESAKQHPYKLNDLYLVNGEVRRLVMDRRLARILTALVGSEVAICNSLNFERGSQQAYHFDTYYMPGPCTNGLIVTSICLEDVHADAGPLTYYPGSHTIPPYRFSHGGLNAVPEEMDDAIGYAQDELAARGLVAEEFIGRRGDVFIWHEQLCHGGAPISDLARTRRSLVTHYWRADRLVLDPGWSKVEVTEEGATGFYLARHHQPVTEPVPAEQ
jgi:Phytanoyl-CoA dioxygenase (PhyH)